MTKRTISSNSFSSSLKSSISLCKSRTALRWPYTRRRERGRGWGCGGLGSKSGNLRGLCKSVGVATDISCHVIERQPTTMKNVRHSRWNAFLGADMLGQTPEVREGHWGHYRQHKMLIVSGNMLFSAGNP